MNRTAPVSLQPPATGRIARDNATRVPADGFTDGGADGKALPGWVAIDARVAPVASRKPERDADSHIVGAPHLERAAIQAGQLLAAYDSLERGEKNLVEVLACERPAPMDLGGNDPSVFQYGNLLQITGRVARFVAHVRADWVLLRLDALRPGSETVERKVLHVYLGEGRVCLDLLHESDRLNPLWNGVLDEKNHRLYRRKWPVELWAQECFDPGSCREA